MKFIFGEVERFYGTEERFFGHPICSHNWSHAFAEISGGMWKQKTPSTFQFIGSNDAVCNKDSEWTVLGEVVDRKVKTLDEVFTCDVRSEVYESFPCQKFRCLGIKVMKVPEKNGGKYYATLDNFRMWVRGNVPKC